MRSASPEAAAQHQPTERMVLALLAAPGVAHDLAAQLAQELPGRLGERFPEIAWKVVVDVDSLAGAAGVREDLTQLARRRMLDEGWDLVIVLTDLPLHVGRRPVTAHASSALGVGVVSVPALGVLALETRVREAVLRVVDRLLDQQVARRRVRPTVSAWRLRMRWRSLTSPVGQAVGTDERTVRFVTATFRGNLRLLVGMVRANRPWRLAAGLSRALVAALGTAAFAITSPGIWLLMNGMSWVRLLGLSIGSVLAISVTLIVVHGLWERSPRPDVRQRVVLINLATALTIAVGILTHYVALLVINAIAAAAIIAPTVFQIQLHHPVGAWEYLKLAWLVSSLATIGGALGAAVENETAVREAAYGYRDD